MGRGGVTYLVCVKSFHFYCVDKKFLTENEHWSYRTLEGLKLAKVLWMSQSEGRTGSGTQMCLPLKQQSKYRLRQQWAREVYNHFSSRGVLYLKMNELHGLTGSKSVFKEKSELI